MKRTQLGVLFGQPGMYISQPGDDLDDPEKALLLDSRYDALELHAFGREQMGREVISNETFYRSVVNFTGLGYRPLFFVAPVRRGDSRAQYYSTGLTADGIINAFNAKLNSSWNELTVEFSVLNNDGPSYDFLWVIYRNPA